METWNRPLPVASGETKPFWDACNRGVFLIQQCDDCRLFQYHYRGFCCHCWSKNVTDVPIQGTGEVWTFSVVERTRMPGFSELTPYVIAVVELTEGVRVLTNVINCDPASIEIGTPVSLTFVRATPEWNLAMFEPVRDS